MVLMRDHLQLRDSVGISPTSLPRGTFDLTAFARSDPENLRTPLTVERMSETPKRPLGESITQLLVIVILIGVLIGAVILLLQFLDSHDASQGVATLNGLIISFRR
jgi:hypothetical protein